MKNGKWKKKEKEESDKEAGAGEIMQGRTTLTFATSPASIIANTAFWWRVWRFNVNFPEETAAGAASAMSFQSHKIVHTCCERTSAN
jgi:hypothetical protein